MKVIWLETAQQQLDDIYEFVAQQSVKAAVNIYNDIIDATDILCEFPEIATVESLLANEAYTYRSLVVRHKYKVVYRVDSNSKKVIVSSIWDCRQNPKLLKKRIIV